MVKTLATEQLQRDVRGQVANRDCWKIEGWGVMHLERRRSRRMLAGKQGPPLPNGFVHSVQKQKYPAHVQGKEANIQRVHVDAENRCETEIWTAAATIYGSDVAWGEQCWSGGKFLATALAKDIVVVVTVFSVRSRVVRRRRRASPPSNFKNTRLEQRIGLSHFRLVLCFRVGYCPVSITVDAAVRPFQQGRFLGVKFILCPFPASSALQAPLPIFNPIRAHGRSGGSL